MFSDQPIQDSNSDLFGRKAFSKRIAQIITKRTDSESVTIGIHAPWGEGKTSVLNMIVENLEQFIQKKDGKLLDGHLVVVRFNPWRYSDENQLLANFFTALGEALDKSTNYKQKIGDKFKKYAWLTSPLEAVKFSFAGVLDAKLDAKETIEKLGEELSKTTVEELKEEIEKILKTESRKIVVIMDDIDRLDKEEVQSVFRLIKLTADFPNTIYLLAFDIERVSEALADKYGSKEAGRSFLEKIIQLSLPLPPLTSDKLIKLTYDEINKLLEENRIELLKDDDSQWSYFFIRTFSPFLKSPRLVKKYINNLWFSLPETKDELNVLDLQTIEAVHTFFPELYDVIRNNKNLFLLEKTERFSLRDKEEKEYFDKLRKIVEKFPEEQRDTIKKIIQEIFPRTTGAFSNTHHGKDWISRWTKSKRIASPKYFQRYFDFGVADSDISDVELNRFISNLNTKTEAENSSEIENLVSNNRSELFLQKLAVAAENIEKDKITKLAKSIALSGNHFPTGDFASNFLIQSPLALAAKILSHLLEKIEDETLRLNLGIEIASFIQPLTFAYEYFRWIQYIGKDKDNSESELTPLAEAVLKRFVKRIEVEANEELLEKRYPLNSSSLYYTWLNGNQDSLKKYLKNKIEKNREYAKDFILSFARQSSSVNGVARRVSGILCKLVQFRQVDSVLKHNGKLIHR